MPVADREGNVELDGGLGRQVAKQALDVRADEDLGDQGQDRVVAGRGEHSAELGAGVGRGRGVEGIAPRSA